MNFKAIQKEWYDRLKKEGFNDAEDYNIQDRPLKRWTGTPSLISINNNTLVNLIDLYVHQPAESEILSSFPSPTLNVHFMNFEEISEFICRQRNTTLTPKLVREIWDLHVAGCAERKIEKILQITDTQAHNAIRKVKEWIVLVEMNNESYEEEKAPLKATVIIRLYNHATDAACIYTTWRNNLWYAADLPEAHSNEFYRVANKNIRQLLGKKDTRVKIACLSDDPDQIVGYSVINAKNLEWVYVKKDYRRQKIATLLCKDFDTISMPMTSEGFDIARKKNMKIKGESDGTGEDETKNGTGKTKD